MSFIVVQSLRTNIENNRILRPVGTDRPNDLPDPIVYEDYEAAAIAAEPVKAGRVIKKKDFKHYVKCDDLYRMTEEAAKEGNKQ